jgi:sugar phosphate isomerase/epimerase
MNGPDLIALATRYGLSGVEFPFSMLPDRSPAGIDRFREMLDARGLSFVVDTPVIDVGMLREQLPMAKRASARFVRAQMSGFLEGARAVHVPDWKAYVREIQQRIVAIRPLLEELDLVLAIENHQDAMSDDLIALAEAGNGRVGVTFDVVNPLAVAEEPFAFARKLGPLIYNVHIKDYTIHRTESGYRLVRAAIGQGVIDWRAMLTLLREVAPNACLHIELAALYARHIRLFEDQWWRGYPPRDARDLLPLLRFVAQHASDDHAPWQTPWEREDAPDSVERYERGQFESTVRYMREELADLL